jgi:hypothetical protein
MSESALAAPAVEQPPAEQALAPAQPCRECLGDGGWYRYEPALDPAPGVLYLFCLHCRGSGRAAGSRA